MLAAQMGRHTHAWSVCSLRQEAEGAHHNVGLPEAVPQKCMDVPRNAQEASRRMPMRRRNQ
eukprot:357733-Pelagomonas_calceolata.AAC.11